MKPTRPRPPLHLTEPEPQDSVGPAPEPVSGPSGMTAGDPPMSERRRRRLADEQRRAQEHLQPEPGQWATDIPPISLSASADAPPVAYEPPPAPLPMRRRETKAPGGNAYLIAGVASALWVG